MFRVGVTDVSAKTKSVVQKEADAHNEEMAGMLQRLEKLTKDGIMLRAEVASKVDSEAQARYELSLSQAEATALQVALEQRSERLEALRREKDAANAELKARLAEAQLLERDATLALQHAQVCVLVPVRIHAT